MNKQGRYQRIVSQLEELFVKTKDPTSRMATIASLLHNKFDSFSWTGFYRLVEGKLIVGPYQGLIACLVLKEHVGVCWHAIDTQKTVVVTDVHKFPGHIACDSRSNSEIVVSVKDRSGSIVAVLDVDSTQLNNFDDEDAKGLEKIAEMIY
jgi:GAF domain-containing protein